MNKRCIGCGVELQCEDSFEDGYVNPKLYDKVVMCRRCFRLKNYGEYKIANKSNVYYQRIIRDILKTNELVIHLIDIFNMDNMDYIYSRIFSPCILVISKMDIYPKSIKEEKFIEYFKNRYPKYIDVVCISSDKNYNMDLLYEKIMKYKTSEDVYVLGNTNAGKSSFINKMIKNYTESNNYLVTSYMPSTTLNVISIKINDELTLLDTPGLVSDSDIYLKLDEDTIKNVIIKHEINPRIYQLLDKNSLILKGIGRIDILDDSNLVIYISNNVDITHANFYTNDTYRKLELTRVRVKENQDLVIEGLCIIKCSDNTEFEIYMPEGVDIYKRDKLI